MSKKYVRISRTFANYALYPEDVNIDELIQNSGPNEDYYRSIYYYDENHYNKFINALKRGSNYVDVVFDQDKLLETSKKVWNKLKFLAEKKNDIEAEQLKTEISISRTEDVVTNKLVFDFDSSNPELAKNDTLTLVSRLNQNGISKDAIQICFSGNKGFSVEIETDTWMNRKQFENAVLNLSGDLETFDTSIKDEQRLFRLPLTYHKTSKLYKIPLTQEQLTLPISEIKKLAKPENVQNNIDNYYDIMDTWLATPMPTGIKRYTEITTEQKKEKDNELSHEDRLELARKPAWLSATKFALQEGFFESGERNSAFMILAATYKANGFAKEIAWRMLKGVAELQAKRNNSEKYSENKLWKEIISVVYSPNWKGGTYSETETALLKKVAEKFNLEIGNKDSRNLISIRDVSDRFLNFAQNIDKNTIKTGIKTIDENILITTGMAVGILGSPSSGKTTVANEFVKNLSLNGQHALFESLDMSDNLLFARQLQKFCGYSLQNILYQIKTLQIDKKLSNAFEMVKEQYKNVGFNFRSGTSVDDIENDIKNYKNKVGDDLKLVVIDYLEKVRGPYSDPTANSGYVASRLTDLAREYNLTLLMLLQPQKSAGDPSEPLLNMRKVKGASVIEQDCRIIMTIWRPGFNPQDMSDDRFASIAVVKNNMGELGQYDFSWNGLSGQIKDLTPHERYELDDLIKRKEAERQDDDF